ncbi:hypothetical protein KY290_023300 [Solanum tuberosum]|uniref:Uncharacterized protein n=1 Tax=Solanum tuberosum TaxID=4113 RepID=A0ABQ7V6X0_SOLTU|nr:hypothetical protein KY290_023300 [Solanum tuberosum]
MVLPVVVFVLMLLLTDVVSTHFIVETLPGFDGQLPFKLETGYIGVGEEEKLQLFYYFVESERDPQNDPLIIWLTGGPGGSGLSAFLYEIGPLTFDYANSSGNFPKLELNLHSWTKVANIIFIDQPVGTGYSYAKTSEAYNSNDTLSATLTYDFLRKWLMDHPEYLKNPLYVGGGSYAGIYIALITRKIYDGVEVGDEPQMNIKGYIQGNALTDTYTMMNSRVKYAYHMGLISDKIYQSAKANCKGNYVDIDPNNILCLNDLQKVKKVNFALVKKILLLLTSIIPNAYSIYLPKNWCEQSLFPIPGPWCWENNYIYSEIWANDKAVQKALNVCEGTILEWVRCNYSMSYNVHEGMKRTESYVYDIQTSIDDHRHLTSKSCRALIYSGDHDMTISHLSTEEWIDTLKLPIVDDWEPWFVEDQVAGYKVKYIQNDYELTYATVKGAGHTAPEYKPQQCLPMVDRWFSGDPL